MASHEETAGSRQSLTGADSEAATHRHHRKGHRRSLVHTNIAESMKVKQVIIIAKQYKTGFYFFFAGTHKSIP